MSGKSFAQVEGLEHFEMTMRELPEAFHRTVLLSALRRGTTSVVETARSRAPRGTDPRKRGSKKQRKAGESVRIGAGAASIAARTLRVDRANPGLTSVAVSPSSDHWYMRFNEFGTSRQPKRAFLRPAFDSHVEDVIRVTAREVGRSVERTARRLAAQAASGKLSRKARRALGA